MLNITIVAFNTAIKVPFDLLSNAFLNTGPCILNETTESDSLFMYILPSSSDSSRPGAQRSVCLFHVQAHVGHQCDRLVFT